MANHTPGSPILHYAGQLVPEKGQHDTRENIFFLSGLLDALDAENEWFCDGRNLYLWPPGGVSPAELDVQVKVRDYCIESHQPDTRLSNLYMHACTFALLGCNGCEFDIFSVVVEILVVHNLAHTLYSH